MEHKTYKSRLLEFYQQNGKVSQEFTFETRTEGQGAHKMFRCTVTIPELRSTFMSVLCQGFTGEPRHNKKDAEHSASKMALQFLAQKCYVPSHGLIFEQAQNISNDGQLHSTGAPDSQQSVSCFRAEPEFSSSSGANMNVIPWPRLLSGTQQNSESAQQIQPSQTHRARSEIGMDGLEAISQDNKRMEDLDRKSMQSRSESSQSCTFPQPRQSLAKQILQISQPVNQKSETGLALDKLSQQKNEGTSYKNQNADRKSETGLALDKLSQQKNAGTNTKNQHADRSVLSSALDKSPLAQRGYTSSKEANSQLASPQLRPYENESHPSPLNIRDTKQKANFPQPRPISLPAHDLSRDSNNGFKSESKRGSESKEKDSLEWTPECKESVRTEITYSEQKGGVTIGEDGGEGEQESLPNISSLEEGGSSFGRETETLREGLSPGRFDERIEAMSAEGLRKLLNEADSVVRRLEGIVKTLEKDKQELKNGNNKLEDDKRKLKEDKISLERERDKLVEDKKRSIFAAGVLLNNEESAEAYQWFLKSKERTNP